MTLIKTALQDARLFAGATLVALAMSCAGTARAQAPKPSFNCAKARTADERTICSDARLAELDRAVSLAYAHVPDNMREGAKGEAKELLAARGKCRDDRLCILEQQVGAITLFANLGAPVRVPPWVGAYRLDLVKARGLAAEPGIPTEIGHCTMTKITSVGTRFGDKLGARPT